MDLTAPRSDAGCDVDDVAGVMATLASPSRLAIVRLLADAELDFGEISHRLGASVATTSHHLGPLRRAGLVTSRRDGTRILNPHRRPPRARPVRRGVRHGPPTRARTCRGPTMMSTPTAVLHARDAPSWTLDAGDYDAWFDTPWGRHAWQGHDDAIAVGVEHG